MSKVATMEVSEKYSEKFHNFEKLFHPDVFWRPEFGALLQKAIDRNSPLTSNEVEAEFGPLNWEW